MDDLGLARLAARTAAEIVLSWRDRLESADFKGVVDPVTAADREAEEAIVGLLAEQRPDDGVLAEEGSGTDSPSGRRWLIDPLDGTVNFIHGFPQVAVSVALHDDEGPLVAVVRDVFRSEEFTATRAGGAHLDGAPIGVTGRSDIGTALVSTGFGYDRHERAGDYLAVVEAVMRRVRGVRRAGSAALDLAWVACGRLDAHWEFNLSPWDVAAGMLLVTEAGGRVSSSRGGEATHRDIVASNGALHEALLEIVGPVAVERGLG
jgi:myo-inositol-1(or 4)-monophosphatase